MLLIFVLNILFSLRYVMNAKGCNFDLLLQPVIANLFIPRSMYAQSTYCCSLFSCGSTCSILSKKTTRSRAYVEVVMEFGDVLKW